MSRFIELEGVRVHNLRNVAVRIPRGQLTVVCGVSGSGKSSLAFDTLFAEGQRRYIETFSPTARQFLDRLERPAADRIDGIPPAIAIRQQRRRDTRLSTVGTRTEIVDALRVLFANCATLVCPECGQEVESADPARSAEEFLRTHRNRRAMVTFPASAAADVHATAPWAEQLLKAGFTRVIVGDTTRRTDEPLAPADLTDCEVVLDRISLRGESSARLAESLAAALSEGQGKCLVYLETDSDDQATQIDGRRWSRRLLSQRAECNRCGRTVERPQLSQLSFTSPLGACQACEGTGVQSALDLTRAVPDDSLTLRDGAVEPWNTDAWSDQFDSLLRVAERAGIPVDVPFRELTGAQRDVLIHGLPESDFDGLNGLHERLQQQRARSGTRAALQRWRSWQTCDSCGGSRLRPIAHHLRLAGHTLPEVCELEIGALAEWTQELSTTDNFALAGVRHAVRQLTTRVQFLLDSGLHYLALSRSIRSLSGGETQRVLLTTALGSGLINTLYVLDEPTSGLSESDTQRIITIVQRLRQLGNTVVVVEHDPEFIQAADVVVEIGPEAGVRGGEIVFTGSPAELISTGGTPTSDALSRLAARVSSSSTTATATAELVRAAVSGDSVPEPALALSGVSCHNIHDLDVAIPLGLLCAVTGVSGSGKSSLVVESLYPAVCRAVGQPLTTQRSGSVAAISGTEHLSAVGLLDQSPLQKTDRSVPATWIGVFDDIRRVLASTHEARRRNLKPGAFSFNAARGGRCPVCHGRGVVTVEMQFLADVETQCEECNGRRFRSDILEVRYRDRSVSDILDMTADESFQFFTGQRRIQQRLSALRQAGLGYIQLGQPLSTLSGGEAQRLRIAALLAGLPSEDDEFLPRSPRRAGTPAASLYILDEPSTGLHLRDLEQLVTCLRHLVQTGHSVVVIEHDTALIRHCDYVIEMGPGGGNAGGKVVSQGRLKPLA